MKRQKQKVFRRLNFSVHERKQRELGNNRRVSHATGLLYSRLTSDSLLRAASVMGNMGKGYRRFAREGPFHFVSGSRCLDRE